MADNQPILDIRKADDIAIQLKELTKRYLKEWNPKGEDAGTVLHYVFARLMELVLERLNRAPEKNFLLFLNMVGIELMPPSPAVVPLTFTPAGRTPVFVPKGSQADTKPSPQSIAVGFETQEELTAIPARITALFTVDPIWGRFGAYLTQERINEDGFALFLGNTGIESTVGEYDDKNPTLYIGFDAVFPEQPVTLYASVMPRAYSRGMKNTTSCPTVPRLIWEYFNGTRWDTLTVIDSSSSFTQSGTITFLTPDDMQTLDKFNTSCFFIRVIKKLDDGKNAYRENDSFDTLRLKGIFLNTVPAVQGVTIEDEILGSSSGEIGQTMYFSQIPILKGQRVMVREIERPDPKECEACDAIKKEEGNDAVQVVENIYTGEKEIWVIWHEVPNFICSRPHSRHYTLDHTSGLITFGDGKRGYIPPQGIDNIKATYRVGGGTAGNVPEGAVTVIKSVLPMVESVTNLIPSDGGAEIENVDMVKVRGPHAIRHRNYAVTANDYEWMARQAVGTRVARAKCLPNINEELCFEEGWVTLIIVPQGNEDKLLPSSELIRQIEDYIKTHAFGGGTGGGSTKLNVIGSGYIEVSVEVEVVPQDIREADLVKKRVLKAIENYFHPLTGGIKGCGREFGRNIYIPEICRVIKGVSGVDHINLETLSIKPNIIQQRIRLQEGAKGGIAKGSIIKTDNLLKSAVVVKQAEAGINSLDISGFKEGDRITVAVDVKFKEMHEDNVIIVESLGQADLLLKLPSGSPISTPDGLVGTYLNVEKDGYRIEILEKEFAASLKSDTILTIFYPHPMSITAITPSSQSPDYILNIQNYKTEIEIPCGTVLATLDNCIRFPLSKCIEADKSITEVTINAFNTSESILASRMSKLTIINAEPVTDAAYLEGNFLAYSGTHRVDIVGGKSTPKRGCEC